MSDQAKVKQWWLTDNGHIAVLKRSEVDDIHVLEAEPTLALMDEMAEALEALTSWNYRNENEDEMVNSWRRVLTKYEDFKRGLK